MSDKLTDDIIDSMWEYIQLLEAELNDTVSIASVHGWRSHRAEEGREARNKIQNLLSLKYI